MNTVTLINPPMVYSSKGISFVAIPPIGLAYVAAELERHGEKVRILDGIAEWSDQYYWASYGGRVLGVNGGKISDIVGAIASESDIIGISCMFMHQWPLIRDLIAGIRARFPVSKIILGGEQATGAAETILAESSADYIVLGEGEETMTELVAAIRADVLDYSGIAGLAIRNPSPMRTMSRSRIRAIDSIARPAWHLVPVETYMNRKMFHGPSLGRTMPIMATRGCPYQCTFCTSPQMWTTSWLPRDPADVVDEMASYREHYGATDFQFVDLTAILKRSWILDFCDEIGKRHWVDVTWQLPSGTRSEAIDFEVATRLKAAGCSVMTYAPESGSTTTLKRIKKKVKLGNMYTSIRAARKAGMTVECFVILGFPDETFREVLATYWFLVRIALMGVESTPISGYRPTPGTEISDDLIRRGLIEWNDELFVDLVESSTIWGGRSYNPRWSHRQLASLRLAGFLIFFAASFIARPWRPFRIALNVLRGRQTSKLEKSLIELRKRRAPSSLEAAT